MAEKNGVTSFWIVVSDLVPKVIGSGTHGVAGQVPDVGAGLPCCSVPLVLPYVVWMLQDARRVE